MFSNSGVRFLGVVLACLGAVAMIIGFCSGMNVPAIVSGLGCVIAAAPFICIGNIETYLQKIYEQQKEILEYQKKQYLASIKKA